MMFSYTNIPSGSGDIDDRAGHLHIRRRGRRIAGQMIVRSRRNFIQVVIAALRESPVGTFETCPDVCLPVAIRGKADVTRT